MRFLFFFRRRIDARDIPAVEVPIGNGCPPLSSPPVAKAAGADCFVEETDNDEATSAVADNDGDGDDEITIPRGWFE